MHLPRWSQPFVGRASAAGLVIAIGYWLTEAALHAYVFDHTDYLESALHGTSNELWMRAFTGVLFLVIGGLTQRYLHQLHQHLARERLLAGAIEQAGDSIILTDAKGIIEYANPSFTRITGYRLEDVKGKTPAVLQSGLTDKAYYQTMWGTILSGQVWTGDITDRRKDDTFYPARLTIAPVKNERGAITHFVGIQHDLSERVTLEERVRQAQKLETLGTLIGGIAHDFNNVLALLTLQLQLATTMTERTSELGRLVEEMIGSVATAASMIRGLVRYARPVATETSTEPVELHEFFTRVWPALRLAVPVAIHARLESKPGIWARIEPAAMQQVVLNLVYNARDALLARGSGNIVVSCDEPAPDVVARLVPSAAQGNYARIVVADDGPGVPEALRARVFEPFFTTKIAGSGLGLAMVRELVQRRGGHLVLESPPEGGARFHVLIPAVSPLERQPAGAVAEAPRGHGELVLLADDRQQYRASARRLLESLGYRVLEAADGMEAVDVFFHHQQEVRVLVFDAMMPRMSGAEAALQIRKLNPTIPVLIATGFDAAESERQKLAAPVEVITKPFGMELLAQRLRTLVDGHAADASARPGPAQGSEGKAK